MAPIICRRALGFLVLLAAIGTTARAVPVPYTLDPRYATIGFSTSGLLGTHGYFEKFTGMLVLDVQAPEHSAMNVTLDDRAIVMSYPAGVGMLRSAAYFDSANFPQIRFRSLSVSRASSPGHFEIRGALTIRGITKPQTMEALLLDAPTGSHSAGTADVYVTGTLRRSAFGMVADRTMVNDAVVLNIHARVMLAK